ncbi:hypothetical protein DPX16_0286 [Anabarilius grahami]|uniref:Uncharacterized protein n=1 Tax=Anabarilius grahami TaxID=495550 RepID=A0A3N0XVC7_ANAGA|nr:hypothetical protein DPX16_0286 [Anabarilius grahami]
MNMVLENNAITLRQIQRKIIENNKIFPNIDRVSLSTLGRVLRRNNLRMKQVYRVPFERNSERVKELRYNYVQPSIRLISTEYVPFRYFTRTAYGERIQPRRATAGNNWTCLVRWFPIGAQVRRAKPPNPCYTCNEEITPGMA